MIHGQSKINKAATQQDKLKEKQIAQRITNSLNLFFKVLIIQQLRKGQVKIEQPYQFNTILIKLCPDINTLYNHRRDIILDQIKNFQLQQQKQNILKLLTENLQLTTMALKEQNKSYTIWNFRQWLVLKIRQYQGENNQTPIFKLQLKLCQKILQKDLRNFHVWNYRNWLCSTESSPEVIQQELQFIKKKISENPSNFSAYHFRIINFNKLYSNEISSKFKIYGLPFDVYKKELQMVKTAVYLDTNQQGPWLYYEWLMNIISPIKVIQIKKQSQKIRLIFNDYLLEKPNIKGYRKQEQINMEFKVEGKQVCFDDLIEKVVIYGQTKIRICSNCLRKNIVRTSIWLSDQRIVFEQEQLKSSKEIYKEQLQFLRELEKQNPQSHYCKQLINFIEQNK